MSYRPGSTPARPAIVPASPSAAGTTPRVVGVKRLADYLKRKVESDPNLRNVSVRGEISNFSVQRNGRLNFDLKEDDALIRCFAWESDAASFPQVGNGVAIVATGSVTAYPTKSSYQIIVREVVLEGVGNIHAEFEERKRKLDAEGLFDAGRKRPLPAFPFRVAIVSSRTSDGAIDFVTQLRMRAPHVAVVWCETIVQGPNAPPEICAALRKASASDVDCIVITRGGGAFEDLFAFSDEAVVRAVAKARHPVVSAIGHTADQQLCDFAADLHVATPSAAAKAVGFDSSELFGRTLDRALRLRRAFDRHIERFSTRLARATLRSRLSNDRAFLQPLAQNIDALSARLERTMEARTNARSQRLREVAKRLEGCDPTRRLAARELDIQRLSMALDTVLAHKARAAAERVRERGVRLDRAIENVFARRSRAFELVRVRLDGNSPQKLLQQGYAIVTYGDKIVRDAADVPAGGMVDAQLARGTLSARVERKDLDGN